jgi:dTDP-L-rhamnose 4-epimerase
MADRVLITGGAGFIGSHLTDHLLRAGYRVRLLDDLVDQVHGAARRRPAYLDPRVELRVADVRDPGAVRRAVKDVDAVFHLAAAVGVGQSMYQIPRYVDTNAGGTAVLLDALLHHPVKRLVVASSMSVYGEGLYRTSEGQAREPGERGLDQLRAGRWEPEDERGDPLTPVPTPETKTPCLASVYALSKYAQERLALITGRAYGIPVVALRFFNVYGPRQALSNPYTGVLAIFAARLLNGAAPIVYEDGYQQRDFVSVHDVARACLQALTHPDAPGQTVNVGSGQPHTVRDVAALLARMLGRRHIEPVVSDKYRAGDIRHCFADISRARQVLGFEPRVTLREGLEELAEWLEGQRPEDRVERANAELHTRGLTV